MKKVKFLIKIQRYNVKDISLYECNMYISDREWYKQYKANNEDSITGLDRFIDEFGDSYKIYNHYCANEIEYLGEYEYVKFDRVKGGIIMPWYISEDLVTPQELLNAVFENDEYYISDNIKIKRIKDVNVKTYCHIYYYS